MIPRSAIRLQERLAGKVCIEKLKKEVRLVAGADLAFSPDGKRCLAGVVVYDVRERAVIEETLAWRSVRFPVLAAFVAACWSIVAPGVTRSLTPAVGRGVTTGSFGAKR